MKPIEIVEKIHQRKPEVLKGIPHGKVAAVLRSAFQEIAIAVRETNEGELVIPGFGIFRIKQVEHEKDGAKTFVKRVTFRLAPKQERAAE